MTTGSGPHREISIREFPSVSGASLQGHVDLRHLGWRRRTALCSPTGLERSARERRGALPHGEPITYGTRTIAQVLASIVRCHTVRSADPKHLGCRTEPTSARAECGGSNSAAPASQSGLQSAKAAQNHAMRRVSRVRLGLRVGIWPAKAAFRSLVSEATFWYLIFRRPSRNRLSILSSSSFWYHDIRCRCRKSKIAAQRRGLGDDR